MDALFLQQYGPAITNEATTAKDLVEAVAQYATMDSNTGKVTINDQAAIEAEFRRVRGQSMGDQLAQNFISLLHDGFAQPDEKVTGLKGFSIPWRALTDAKTLDCLTPEVYDWLGVKPWGGTVLTHQRMSRNLGQPPRYMLEEQRLEDLRGWAWRSSMNAATPPMYTAMLAQGGSSIGLAAQRVLSGVKAGGSPPSVAPDVIDQAVELAQKCARYLLDAPWEYEWARKWYPVGVAFRLNKTAADVVEEALWGVAGPKLLAAVVALKGATITAASMLGAFGGWAGLALFHFTFHWACLIHLGRGPNGVRLIHFYPWNSAIFGGILNGYCEPIP